MRLQQLWNRYNSASRQYRRLRLAGTPSGRLVDPDRALARARQEEAHALAEYLRAIRDLCPLYIRKQPAGRGNSVEFDRDYRLRRIHKRFG